MFPLLPRLSEGGAAEVRIVALTDASSRAVGQIEASIRRVFPDPAWLSVRTTASIVHARTSREQIGATLFSWFGATAAILAVTGVYGLVAFEIARRRRELGIRIALGATYSRAKRLAVRSAVVPVALGVSVGGLAAWLLGRVLENAVGPAVAAGPAVFLSVAGLEALGALCAAWLAATAIGRMALPAELSGR
jgi:ABC-type antimicrobial peptide transport system permease subunit